MKKGLLEKIKSRGYWRVNFQPVVVKKFDKLKQCAEIVEKSSVELRGWDYPHIPRRGDESSSMQPCGEYWEAWEEWENFKEFWRMYKSGQFLYYRGLREDWFEEDQWRRKLAETIKPGTSLAVWSSVICEITEMFEFLSRLVQNGLYEDGVRVNISLNNIESRELWIEERMRGPFMYPRKTGAKEIKFTQVFSKEEIISDSKMIANKFIIQVFDSFGFNPTPEQITIDQDKLLSGRF